MTTNFFEIIAGLNISGNWKITIQTEDNTAFTVSALFTALQCGDNAAKAIPPMLLNGTASELDNGFFETITGPIQQTAGLYSNMESYLKGLEAAKLASKQEQDNREKAKKQAAANKSNEDIIVPDAKINKEEKKKAYDDAMREVAELVKKLKFSDALNILPSIADYPHKEGELKKKTDYLKTQISLYEKALINFNAE
ncbi:PRTRC system protein E [Mucilaginibacter glaciei]|uniref:PRTRC system protein E n=1 Tax=Mucilaginibacter glaciei TaxID=2772109 RepID=A0A926NW32_9SPHI|nr:PRTRC system protein E [Mucilaginibacter glaciei]MBD1395115.1 PRTRC system protein E [Mucilaginibacter glaciei]